MTCKHVLDLIDAGPFVDVSPAQHDAVQQHARDCAACARALQAAQAIASDLRSLSSPAAPPDLTAAVMAAIARMEPKAEVPASTRERSVGVTSLAALASGVTILLATVLTGSAGSSWRPIGAGVPMPTAAAALALTTGLVLYLGGLFAPVGRALRR